MKTRYDTDKLDAEKKSVLQTKNNIAELVKRSNYNAKISKTESKITSISGLATNSALTAVENKISNIRLVKRSRLGYKSIRY